MKPLRVLNLLVALAFAASLFVSAPAAGAQAPASQPAFVPGEAVVGLYRTAGFASFGAQALALADTVDAQVVKLDSRGTALLRFSADADVQAMVASLQSQAGVTYAEPNYLYRVPELVNETPGGNRLQREYVLRRVTPSAETQGKDLAALPIASLQAMRRGTKAVYPNDPYLWWNNGWSTIGADIVSSNATASKNVCVIDTGVDNSHLDLGTQVVMGYDFVNGDAIPMDDHGHGTHVAGIIAAKKNNAQGIAGVSTGKVVAVKVLDAQGFGTNYDVAAGINYCANRADVNVLNLSLGGPDPSTALYNALQYAVNTKGKLVVAAAGNDGSPDPIYPAGYSTLPEFANKVLSVGASGMWVYDAENDYWWVDNGCKADYSNYGDWVSVVGPGTDIYSTTPWDKPFYLNFFEPYLDTRYGSLSGTSMATPFVAGAAARRWGYKPLETNAQIGGDVVDSGWEVNADDSCWPASMAGIRQVNVAYLLDRGAVHTYNIFDASTGLPLNGATVGIYKGTTLYGSGTITPDTWKSYPWEDDPNRIYMSFGAGTDIINLPIGYDYIAKVSKTGYTASPQPAFQHMYSQNPDAGTIYPGAWNWISRAAVPPMSPNFDLAVAWWNWLRDDYALQLMDEPWDLNSDLWLPYASNPLDPGQPASFIVGPEGDDFGLLEGDTLGVMTAFPFARFKRDGGMGDWVRHEDITISNRKAHGTLAANAALPYYPGEYTLMVGDYGQTIDHDLDGCGDNYGYNFDPDYDQTIDPNCAGKTLGIPLLGAYMDPWVYVWKDGVIKGFLHFNSGLPSDYPGNPVDTCNAHWWKPFRITSGLSGTPTYTVLDECGDADIAPYAASGFSGGMGVDTDK